jgi:hypothetical protein
MTAVALATLLCSAQQGGARLDPLQETRALDASRRYVPNFALYMASVVLAAKVLAAKVLAAKVLATQQREAKPIPAPELRDLDARKIPRISRRPS